MKKLSEQKKMNAKTSLSHYFRLLFEENGLNFNYDHQVEIEEIVDCIVEAAVEKVAEEMKNHE